jgi:hypothetical protein
MPDHTRHRSRRGGFVHAVGIAVVVGVLAVVPAAAQEPAQFLEDYVEVVKTGSPPDPDHLYRYATTTPYWSVVAVAPRAGQDFDMALTWGSSPPGFFNTTASMVRGGAVEFVAVNSGRLPLNSNVQAGVLDGGTTENPWDAAPPDARYVVELAQGRSELQPAPFGSPLMTRTVTMSANDVVRVWDTHLQVGEVLNVAANGPGDVELFVVRSLEGNDVPSHLASRSSSSVVAQSNRGGPGTMEAVVGYRAPTAGWYGVVMIKRPGSTTAGTYSIGRWL